MYPEFSLSNEMPLSLSIKTASEQSSVLGKTYRILIVEDDSRVARLIAKGLQRSGFLTEIVDNGNNALERACSHEFDLMLLDLNLPGKDGRTILHELRSQGSNLPVIVVTARLINPQDDDITGILANEIVKKPFAMNDLLRKVSALLQNT